MSGNLYHCAMERNQNGKYNIRIRVQFERGGWALSVYFLASSFNAGMKKLEASLQLLQKSEERLRFWGVERTDDPNLAGDLFVTFAPADSGCRKRLAGSRHCKVSCSVYR